LAVIQVPFSQKLIL